MIRKIVISFILVILLAVVSYVKTVREEIKINEKLLSHQIEQNYQIKLFEQKIESLTANLNDSTISKLDLPQKRLDSLLTVISGQDSNLLNSDSNQLLTKKKQIKTVPYDEQNNLSKDQKIYRYYYQRYSSLSETLTIEEKETALTIIREETAKKYSISLEELQIIRNNFNLDY